MGTWLEPGSTKILAHVCNDDHSSFLAGLSYDGDLGLDHPDYLDHSGLPETDRRLVERLCYFVRL